MRQQVNRLSMYGSSKRKAFEKNRVLLIEAKHSLQKKKVQESILSYAELRKTGVQIKKLKPKQKQAVTCPQAASATD